jgi:hypothetical protein
VNILEAIEVLNPATIQILSKEFAKAAKDTREGLDVGTVHVNETVAFDVSGDVRKGESYQQLIVNRVDWIGLCESLFQSLNRTICNARANEALLKLCPPEDRDIIQLNGLESGNIESELEKAERRNDVERDYSRDFERDVQDIMAAIKGTTEKPCSGKVTLSKDAAVLTIIHTEEVVDAEDRLDLWDSKARVARLQELNG